MTFVRILKEGREYLIPARQIDSVEINDDKDDRVNFEDGSQETVTDFYCSLREIYGKEIRI